MFQQPEDNLPRVGEEDCFREGPVADKDTLSPEVNSSMDKNLLDNVENSSLVCLDTPNRIEIANPNRISNGLHSMHEYIKVHL